MQFTSFRVRLVAIAFGVIVLVVIGIGVYFALQPRYLTVSEVWDRRNELKRQRITVRGYSNFIYQVTLQLCVPKRCDCNQSRATQTWLVDKDTFEESKRTKTNPTNTKYIEIGILDCRGDECSMACKPFNPKTDDELEFTGILHIKQEGTPYPILSLDNVQLEVARQNINGVWQPIPTGVFQIQLRQP